MSLRRCVKCGRVIRKAEYLIDERSPLLGKHIVCPGVLPDSTGLWKVSRILDALAGYHA